MMWSKYGLERGKESPLEKRRRERHGSRSNSEPCNDVNAAESAYESQQERLRSQSACEVTASERTKTIKPIEIVDVMSKMKLAPGASLEKSEDGSISSDSPRSPVHSQIFRNDSFDIMVSKRIQDRYKNMAYSEEGQVTSVEQAAQKEEGVRD